MQHSNGSPGPNIKSVGKAINASGSDLQLILPAAAIPSNPNLLPKGPGQIQEGVNTRAWPSLDSPTGLLHVALKHFVSIINICSIQHSMFMKGKHMVTVLNKPTLSWPGQSDSAVQIYFSTSHLYSFSTEQC